MSCSTDDLIGNLEKIRSCGCRWDKSQERDISQVALNEVIVSGPSTSYCLRVVETKRATLNFLSLQYCFT